MFAAVALSLLVVPASAGALFGRNVTVAMVANEFMDARIGRMGGFGFSTAMVGEIFRRRTELGVSVLFVFAEPTARTAGRFTTDETIVHDWPLINMITTKVTANRTKRSASWASAYLRAAHVDLFLLVDWRDDYARALAALPRTPVILWARDPRTQQQRANIEGIRMPGRSQQPGGLRTPSARGAVNVFRALGPSKVAIGMTWGAALGDRIDEAYAISSSSNRVRAFELPNSIPFCSSANDERTYKLPGEESASPRVVFLARLDPYKRPWLLVDLARMFPSVRFAVLGQSHFRGSGSFTPPPGSSVPNLEFLGHVQGREQKEAMLRSAWFVVNLSAHEGVAVSWLEALACRTPILAMVNPGGLVSSFGMFTGEFPGDGTDGLGALKAGFERLLANRTLRAELGAAGRRHVRATHTEELFLRSFRNIAVHIGVSPKKSDSSEPV